MKIREARPGDRERLRELYTAFVQELPAWPGKPLDLEHELAELDEYLDSDEHVALVAEESDVVVGLALGKMRNPGDGHLNDLYVVPEARRRGTARELIRETARRLRDAGAVILTLGVQADNAAARGVYERLGFELVALRLYAPVEELLAEDKVASGETFGSIHVQADDATAVENAVRKYVPRLGRSAGSLVSPPRNGWIAVYDELCDRDPKLLRRLASELSNATGSVAAAFSLEHGQVVRYVLIDRGRVVDEYLSVPDFYGSLPPGDVVALAANPTVVARLTGADPTRIRAVARTAAAPSGLPPASELLAEIAVFGIEGAERGYAGASEAPGGLAVAHG